MKKDSKNMKDKIMNMPAWKAFVFVLMIIFGIGVVAESLFIHTVFHFLQRGISTFAKIDKDDKADMDEMSKNEQVDKCFEYQEVLRTKAGEEANNKYHVSFLNNEYDHNFAINKEERLNIAIKSHLFNQAACQQKLESDGTLEKIRVEAEHLAMKAADDIQRQNCEKYNQLTKSKQIRESLDKLHGGYDPFNDVDMRSVENDESYLKKESEQHLLNVGRCENESKIKGTTEKFNK
jgi:hypothetical protein